MEQILVLALVALPAATGAACLRLSARSSELALRVSALSALTLVLAASLGAVGALLPLPGHRTLELTAIGQFGVELLALAMLGLVLALHREPEALIARWLPVSWFSLAGLVAALLVSSLAVAALWFVAAALLWVFGLPTSQRAEAGGVMLRYLVFVVLALPLLLAGFQVAPRLAPPAGVQALVLAFLVPGFGLVLGLIPLHGWTLTLAGGAPRAMLFGVLALVQTAGFVLLLRTLTVYPWLNSAAREILVFGGALSALTGGWLALSARRDDPDDWLVYAVIATGGIVLVGLGSQTVPAAIGVLLLLLTRVFALLLLALAPRVGSWRLDRLANGVGTLSLAGMPGLAGFPGLWLVLHPLQGAAAAATQLAVLTGSGLLVATAVRRWPGATAAAEPPSAVDATAEAAPSAALAPEDEARGPRWTLYLLMTVLVLIGIVPGLIVPALADVLHGVFLLK